LKKTAGLVHIYYGPGKGKTSIGIGMSIRSAGAGMKVLIYQFMKDNSSSERTVLKSIPGITLIDGLSEEKFTFQMTPEEKEERRKFYKSKLEEIIRKVSGGKYDFLFLDEIIYTIGAGLLEEDLLIRFLKQKPQVLEVVLTGNTPSGELMKHVDYISEIRKEKHPYDNGIPARVGIEK